MSAIARKIEGTHRKLSEQPVRIVREVVAGIKVAIKGMLADKTISERTMKGMDEAVNNLRKGKRSPAADLEKYAKFVE